MGLRELGKGQSRMVLTTFSLAHPPQLCSGTCPTKSCCSVEAPHELWNKAQGRLRSGRLEILLLLIALPVAGWKTALRNQHGQVAARVEHDTAICLEAVITGKVDGISHNLEEG